MNKWNLIIVAMMAVALLVVGCSGDKTEEGKLGGMLEKGMNSVKDAAAPMADKAKQSMESVAHGVDAVKEEGGAVMGAAGDLGKVAMDTAKEGVVKVMEAPGDAVETVKTVATEGLDSAKQSVMDSATKALGEKKDAAMGAVTESTGITDKEVAAGADAAGKLLGH